MEPATPALSCKGIGVWAEDSGYTSYTPGSIELSNENVAPSLTPVNIRITEQVKLNFTPDFKIIRSYDGSVISNITDESPFPRRVLKRRHDEDDGHCSNVLTPTSIIAGGLQMLQVHDVSRTPFSSISSLSLGSAQSVSSHDNIYHILDNAAVLSYPTTPVKRICKTSCKLSPMKKSNKKLNFIQHSLSCESRGIVKTRQSKAARKIELKPFYKPGQKVDIIKKLYMEAQIPAMTGILKYLSNEDICNFILVSPVWCKAWQRYYPSIPKKQEFQSHLRNLKENQENTEKAQTPKNMNANLTRSVKEVHNILNTSSSVKVTPRSPPTTPRTNKFKKFTKAASMDSRLQLCCIRCHQPSKVTVEATGEEWVECISKSCSYQFCKFCKCDRHPGKKCFKYDLEGPSPSKRRKSACAVSSMKSRKNLRRLL